MRPNGSGAIAGRIVRAICVLALLLPTLAFSSGRVPKPVIDIATPGKCVEDTETMRRIHPDLLLHQRDLTMHEGIRTPKYSLKRCVACHASKKTGSVLGKNGFCQSCHEYAAVKIDCFRCHEPRASLASGAAP